MGTHWDTLREADASNKKYLTLSAIFDNWPILKESRGYELVCLFSIFMHLQVGTVVLT